jgi:LAGLIDADG endonuclease.
MVWDNYLYNVIMSLPPRKGGGQFAWITSNLAIPAIVILINVILILEYYCYNYLLINSPLPQASLLLDLKSGLSAISLIYPSETTRSTFTSGIIKNDKNCKFLEWLVGVTDGDGTFYFANTPKGGWTFTFKIGQSNYNLRLLYYIKSNLGVGSVSVPHSKDNTAEFRIRNIQHIIMYILPIFDKYPLLTSKYFSYSLFKKAILIMNDSSLSKEEKNRLISQIKSQSLPNNYISPAWKVVENTVSSVSDVMKIMSKSWLIGFTEAEGSFYLVKKGPTRLSHAFEITQKLDRIVLESIALIFGIKLTQKKTYFTVVTTNSEAIIRIINYYFKTMKGMKALEYRIWARSFNKTKDFESMIKIRNIMRNIRSIRLDKNFKRIK